MASARRSKATTAAPTAPDGTPLKKDGTPRKRPGPAPGTPRGGKSAAKPAATKTAAPKATGDKPARKQNRTKKKTFLIYAVDGTELSFATEAPGLTGQIAVAAAVKAGTLAPNTPYVFLTPNTVARQVEVEAVEREVQYKVKPATKKRVTRPRKQAEPAEDTTTGAEDSPATEPEVSVASPAPGETQENPFAG